MPSEVFLPCRQKRLYLQVTSLISVDALKAFD